jgi:hypothetical protein
MLKMNEGYVTKEVCQIKHKEVDELKEELTKLRECIMSKFTRLNALMFSVLTALVVNLIVMLVKR